MVSDHFSKHKADMIHQNIETVLFHYISVPSHPAIGRFILLIDFDRDTVSACTVNSSFCCGALSSRIIYNKASDSECVSRAFGF